MYKITKKWLFLLLLVTVQLTAHEKPCVSASFDFLWWRPSSSLGYSSGSGFSVFTATEDSIVKSQYDSFNTHRFKENPDPGFRLGIYWNQICQTCWNGHFRWLLFSPSDSKRVKEKKNEAIFNLFVPGLTIVPEAGFLIDDLPPLSKWDLDLQVIDFGISHSFCLHPLITIKPEFSLRYLNTESDFKKKQTGEYLTTEDEFLFRWKARSLVEHDFWGIGPQVGLQSYWFLGYGWNLIGKAEFGMQYGNWEQRNLNGGARFDSTNPSLDTTDLSTSSFEEFHTSRLTSGLQLGLAWQGPLCGCFDAHLQLSWEQLVIYSQINSSNALTMQGLTLSTMVGF